MGPQHCTETDEDCSICAWGQEAGHLRQMFVKASGLLSSGSSHPEVRMLDPDRTVYHNRTGANLKAGFTQKACSLAESVLYLVEHMLFTSMNPLTQYHAGDSCLIFKPPYINRKARLIPAFIAREIWCTDILYTYIYICVCISIFISHACIYIYIYIYICPAFGY